MPAISRFSRRQLWANPTPTNYIPKECRPVRLRAGGLLNIGNETIVNLAHDALFQPECSNYPDVDVNASGFNISVIDDREPFYSSTSPQIYAIATATVVSYMLLIILFITPRTFFVGGAGGGSGFLGRRGMISGASGGTSVIGVGSRPWLQKVAALTVAVSLTIASVDTFRIAEKQYNSGYQDAMALTDAVAGGLEIRIVRIISDTCLWLAQAQTLIRLFPRHKEKVVIKWTAFALILLDVIFSILNSFVYGNAKTRPRTFVDTVPALNYLFAIALSILYMAWVLYYSISKRRFAFFHPKMRNICLMAVLSLTAVVIPVLFFVLDIAKPSVSGWGNYVRWIGAAAASVVVWEWVERIEALERDENKDGILGREIFDGDEMLEITRSAAQRRDRSHDDNGDPTVRGPARGRGDSRSAKTSGWSSVNAIATRLGRSRIAQYRGRIPKHRDRKTSSGGRAPPKVTVSGPHGQTVTPPPTILSPVSRADTTSATSATSATSTVYRIHYHQVSAPIQEAVETAEASSGGIAQDMSVDQRISHETEAPEAPVVEDTRTRVTRPLHSWQRISNHFQKHRTSPPAEVTQALSSRLQPADADDTAPPQAGSRRSNIFNGIRRADRGKAEEVPLPVTIIPWQPRGRAYLESVEDRRNSPLADIERPPSSRQNFEFIKPGSANQIGKRKAAGHHPGSDVNTAESTRWGTPTNSPPPLGAYSYAESHSTDPTSDLAPVANIVHFQPASTNIFPDQPALREEEARAPSALGGSSIG